MNDIQVASNWVVEALNESGYHVEYDVDSLKEIDRFFKEENKTGGILYNDKEGEIKITVVLDADITFYPVISAMKCYENSDENSLYALSKTIEQNI